ncbi:MAG: MaoC family dehydratase [Steroidobacteraceae bacterium]
MALDLPLNRLHEFVGRDLGSSDWVLITQDRINEFARVTGDHQWMHVDIERATRERGGTIAHGLLIASLLPLMSEQIASVSCYSGGYSYGFDKLRFTHPVRCGQRVRLQQTLASVEARQGGQVVTLKCVVEIDGETRPALVADYLALYFP